MKVLVTSFKPFNNSINNYSTEVVKYLKNVDKELLDVVYDECYKTLQEKYNLDEYDLIIATGEARMRDVITLEIQAKNISSCSLKDNNDVLKQNEIIKNDAKELIKTNVKIDLVSDLIKFSEDAGKFVCNNLYYHLLYNYPNKSLFIHVPNCFDKEEEYIKNANVIQKVIEKLSNI